MAAFDFPNSPSNGQTYSANGIDWIYNGSVWKKDATAGVKGQKGEVAEKGQKGEKGEVGAKGDKGDKGDKGQKGEIGATGGSGALQSSLSAQASCKETKSRCLKPMQMTGMVAIWSAGTTPPPPLPGEMT